MRTEKGVSDAMYLLDASVIVNLVKKGCLKPLAEGGNAGLSDLRGS
ncbi:MAG: hypothetical protein QW604_04030 [Fervidicoccaceae archaeon]